MLLFDIIRDWFVMYIWGGYSSTGDHFGTGIGMLTTYTHGGDYDDSAFSQLTDLPFKISSNAEFDYYMYMADWLSTTSTIIVMILLCIVFGLMVRWLFRLTSGLLQGKC